MNTAWEQIYQDKLCSPDEAAERFVHSGDNVYIGGAIPALRVIRCISRLAQEGRLHHITYHGNYITEDMGVSGPQQDWQALHSNSLFLGCQDRLDQEQGMLSYVPLQYGNMARYFELLRPDVAVIQVCPPDAQGHLSVGTISAGYNACAVHRCRRVIAQVNPDLPRAFGRETDIHISQVAAIVEGREELPQLSTGLPTAIDQQIAAHVLDHMQDGDCVQLGIGTIANAVGYGMKNFRHLGVHSEMMGEAFMQLLSCGAVDNSRKTFHPGVCLVGFSSGDNDFYRFTHENKELFYAPYHYLNNSRHIAQNDNMVSINNALAVDLSGQISAESFGYRQYSGTGGQVDYVRGAQWAKNGRSFFVMSSTAQTRQGRVSRVVPWFEPGTAVTTLRTDVQYVATEYGCVDLFGADMGQRAQRLISIAHPDFREQLLFAARQNKLL